MLGERTEIHLPVAGARIDICSCIRRMTKKPRRPRLKSRHFQPLAAFARSAPGLLYWGQEVKIVDNAQRELREWLCRGRETDGEQKLCLEIAGEAQAEGNKERRWYCGLSAKGIPVYEMEQEIPAESARWRCGCGGV